MVSCIGPCRQITAHLEVASGDADLYAREDRAPVIEVGSWDGLGNDNLINLNTFKYNDKVSILALRGGKWQYNPFSFTSFSELQLFRVSFVQGEDFQPWGHLQQHRNLERGQVRILTSFRIGISYQLSSSFYLTVVAHKSYSDARLRIHGYNLKDVRET